MSETALALAWLGFGLTSLAILAYLTEGGLPHRLVVAYPFAVVTVFDVLLLRLASRWASFRAAVWCGVVGATAALGQAAWVRESFGGNSWPRLVAWLTVATLVALALLAVGRGARKFGWSLLVGSAEGFAGMFWVILVGVVVALGGT